MTFKGPFQPKLFFGSMIFYALLTVDVVREENNRIVSKRGLEGYTDVNLSETYYLCFRLIF